MHRVALMLKEGSVIAKATPGQVENFHLRRELAASRESARKFWQSEVLREGRTKS